MRPMGTHRNGASMARPVTLRYHSKVGTNGSTWDAPPKKDVARALLLRGSIFLHLDPRVDGVSVPVYLAKQPQLILQIGLDMPTPIPDLRVDDRGVYGTLSFNRSPFHCMVPWRAVFAMQSDEGRMMLWPESLPVELKAEVERELGQRPPAGLSVVDGGAVAHPADEEITEPERPRGKRPLPPYLRVIK